MEFWHCHMEKLCNLELLPPNGFTVACFPYKVKGGSAGWTRAVALFLGQKRTCSAQAIVCALGLPL